MADSVDTSLTSTSNAVCRLCLSEKTESLKRIFDDVDDERSLQQRIFALLGVEITTDDKLSVMVCTVCIEKITEWNSYKHNCMENQLKLQDQLLQTSNNESDMNIQIKEEPIEIDVDVDVIITEPEVIVNGEDDTPVIVKTECVEDDDGFPPLLSPNVIITEMDDSEVNGNDNPRRCSVCAKTFSSSGNRRKHERLIHGIGTSSISGSEIDQDSQDSQTNITEANSIATVTTATDSEQQKIQFAAGLKLLQRNSTPPITLESLSKMELSYIEKCKAMATMYQSLKCACHNVRYPNLKGLLSHLRSLRIWFPVFTCYHCMITFTDRSSSTRHHLKCARTSLETLIKLSNLKKRSEVKTRLYQNYKCTKCKFMYSFHDDYCKHVDEEHSLLQLPFLCLCGRNFLTIEDYRDHAYVSCLVDYYCDICFATVQTLNEFQKHAQESHDQSEGFVLLQDDNYRPRRNTSPIKREKLDTSIILTSKRRSSYYDNKNIAAMNELDDDDEDSLSKVLNPVRVQKLPGKVCPICDKEFASNANMLRHLKIHREKELIQQQIADNDSYYCCPDCGGMFSSNEWNKHKEFHKKKTCNECGKVFQFQSELDQHRSVHLNLKVYRDSKTQSYKSTMLSPSSSASNNSSEQQILVMCEICDETFTTKDELRKHKLNNHNVVKSEEKTNHRRFACNICNKEYAGYGGLWDHNRRKHPDNRTPRSKEFPKKCKYCDKVFHTGGSYFMHTQMHERINQLQNDNAGSSSEAVAGGIKRGREEDSKEQILSKNKKIKIEKGLLEEQQQKEIYNDYYEDDDDNDNDVESYHTCKRCFKVFSNRYKLKSHMRSHGYSMTQSSHNNSSNKSGGSGKKTKRVWCNICHSPFNNSFDLKQHKLDEHTTRNNNRNDDDNDTKEGMPNLLEDHKNIKTPFIFTCDVCVQTFTSKLSLKKHKESHLKEMKRKFDQQNQQQQLHNNNNKMSYCKYCKLTFSTIERYNYHMLMEHNETSTIKVKENNKSHSKKYVCKICNKGFVSTPALCAHLGWHKRGNTYLKQIDQDVKLILPKKEPTDKKDINGINENNFKCKTCNTILPNDTALQIHILERHRNVNTTILPARCNLCNLDFNSQEKYDEHKKYHKNVSSQIKIKPFSCDYCPATFTRKDSLKVHSRNFHSTTADDDNKKITNNIVVGNKSLYKCSICNLGFDLPKDLRTHTINAHPF